MLVVVKSVQYLDIHANFWMILPKIEFWCLNFFCITPVKVENNVIFFVFEKNTIKSFRWLCVPGVPIDNQVRVGDLRNLYLDICFT